MQDVETMKSIKRRFEKLVLRRPGVSSYIVFAEAVRGQDVSRDRLGRWFRQLVDKTDYDPSIARALLANLAELTKPAEAYGKQG